MLNCALLEACNLSWLSFLIAEFFCPLEWRYYGYSHCLNSVFLSFVNVYMDMLVHAPIFPRPKFLVTPIIQADNDTKQPLELYVIFRNGRLSFWKAIFVLTRRTTMKLLAKATTRSISTLCANSVLTPPINHLKTCTQANDTIISLLNVYLLF